MSTKNQKQQQNNVICNTMKEKTASSNQGITQSEIHCKMRLEHQRNSTKYPV